ncbi:esterase [Paenibacillus albiflavus]|uniref:Esterase n=1 Tax=Paenibacillus albiflavus TaxID=2545760 RepID=A0A4R4ECS9_9BACL|nr:alpha/beta hydrolase-fold protein [Paenibacillus albiflavus]TCZ75961.1 esterase [Paenibacillus albiflavus]
MLVIARKLVFVLVLSFFISFAVSGCTLSVPAKETGGAEVMKAHTDKISLHSDALKKDMNVNVYLPEGYSTEKRYPVLYLLHGREGNENTWIKDMDVSNKATALIRDKKINPLIIVMPNYNNSYGINYSEETYSKAGRQYGRYEDYLTRELIGYIDARYSTIESKDGRYIGGVSMGGFTALFLAFTHQDLFSKAGGHSPAMFMDSTDKLNWLFKDEDMRKRTDPLFLVDEVDLKPLRLYVDYGDHDMKHVIDSTNQLYEKLKNKGVDVKFRASSGGHDKYYWKANTEDYLMFYAGLQGS